MLQANQANQSSRETNAIISSNLSSTIFLTRQEGANEWTCQVSAGNFVGELETSEEGSQEVRCTLNLTCEPDEKFKGFGIPAQQVLRIYALEPNNSSTPHTIEITPDAECDDKVTRFFRAHFLKSIRHPIYGPIDGWKFHPSLAQTRPSNASFTIMGSFNHTHETNGTSSMKNLSIKVPFRAQMSVDTPQGQGITPSSSGSHQF